jgi:choline dehydrogenase-like flavoprotein
MAATFDLNDDTVVVVIGSGAGGGTLGAELALKGIRTVVLEAGPRVEKEAFENDEWSNFVKISWLDNRTTSGSWRVARDFPNLPAWIVKAVGGSTVHWAGASLRIQEHEFKARTNYGEIEGANLLDWPIGLADLEPYYDRAEDRMGVTRTHGIPGLPGNNNFKVMKSGADKLGYRNCHTGRMAINSEPRDGRDSCRQLGFCFQGCKMGAKWSTLYAELPKGEETGNLEVRANAQVLQIEHDESGKVTGVVYADGEGNRQRQKARVVAVAGNSIESPRLLLNSASSMFPDGLANSSGQVGRNYMRHMTASVYATFDQPVHMYRGTTMAGIVTDESINDPSRGFVGGYELETLSLGLPFMAAFLNPGAWGREFASAMDSYENMAGLWIVGEDMPQESNAVTLHPEIKDQHGLPVPDVHFDDHPNDIAMRAHAWRQGQALYDAVGAVQTFPTPPYPSTHNLGTNRMSERPADGVVNKWGQTHDIANLFVSDGSQFTTGAAENPTLTIVALALRQADYIAGPLRRRLRAQRAARPPVGDIDIATRVLPHRGHAPAAPPGLQACPPASTMAPSR